LDRLAGDERIPLDRPVLDDLVADRSALVGNAPAQVQAVTERIAEVVAARPEAAAYDPEPII
jgi:adenylosuccinate lyase